MEDTSFQAYNAAYASLPMKRKEVFEIFVREDRALTSLEISSIIKWPINRVTGRVNELKKKGLLIFGGIKIHNDRRHTAWKSVKPERLF